MPPAQRVAQLTWCFGCSPNSWPTATLPVQKAIIWALLQAGTHPRAVRARIPAKRPGFKSQLCPKKASPASVSLTGKEAVGLGHAPGCEGSFPFVLRPLLCAPGGPPELLRQWLQASAPSWVSPQGLSTSMDGRGHPSPTLSSKLYALRAQVTVHPLSP